MYDIVGTMSIIYLLSKFCKPRINRGYKETIVQPYCNLQSIDNAVDPVEMRLRKG